jgi:aminopeptidase N
MVFYFGKETLKEGLKTYFEKYSFKNTELSDFVNELAAAATKQGTSPNVAFMVDWAESWLKSAGCAVIELDYSITDGKYDYVRIKQTPYNKENTPENKLRLQKFVLALVDKDMKIVKEVTCATSATEAVTEVAELKGTSAQDAFIINYGAHGYAKFVIDEASLKMFETKLHLVEDRLTRNQIYGILYDMIKSGHISGSRVMHIQSNNLKHETAEEVLST